MSATWVEEDRGYETPCHIWQGARDTYGYGLVYRGGKKLAHRYFYELRHGPTDAHLDHLWRGEAVRERRPPPADDHPEHNRRHRKGKPNLGGGGRGRPRPWMRKLELSPSATLAP